MGNANGWNDKTKSDTLERIKAANRKVSLLDSMREFNITFTRTHPGQVWSIPVTCPFPSHKGSKERTPSFGYNFVERRYNCLGCKSSGKAVEFLALMKNVSKKEIADKILIIFSDTYIDEPVEDEDPQFDSLIATASDLFCSSIQKFKDDKSKLDQIDKIVWWFDAFLAIKVPKNNIDVEELKIRLSKVEYLLGEIASQ